MNDMNRTGTGQPIADDSTPKWIIQIHDWIYRNVDLFNPTYPEVKPKSYKPLLKSYHPDGQLSSSELYRLDAAARARIKFGLPDFPILVNRVRSLGPQIRDFFHDCDELDDVNDHDLACMMAIDGLFLLDLFINYHEIMFILLLEYPGRTLIADLLEPGNQFPFFVLEEIVSSNDCCNRFRILPHRMLEFCRVISPFQLPPVYPAEEIEPLHLLDFLYRVVMFEGGPPSSGPTAEYPTQPASLTRFFNRVGDAVFDISRSLRDEREGQRALTHPASRLTERAGIRFQAVRGFEAMGFDPKQRVLNLPKLDRRNLHSADVARNLVAYEHAVCEPNSRILAGYFALMGSLVGPDRKDDVVLEEASVVSSLLFESRSLFESWPKWWARARRYEAQEMKELPGVDSKVGKMIDSVNSCYDGRFGVRLRLVGDRLYDAVSSAATCCV